MTAAAPSGVVTFLFTDVEGSTRRWEADADGMRAALAVHDEVLRTAIEAHGGWVFKHTGDGVCAAFASPRSAVDAAVAAQRELELSVRMGIATGEAELREGDYFGAVLNRAARVMAAGHGGQILLAESTAVLLSGVATSLPDAVPKRVAAGLHLYVQLPNWCDELRLVDTAHRQGLLIEGASRHWSVPSSAPPALVLGYGGIDESAIRTGLEVLASIYHEQQPGHAHPAKKNYSWGS
jgi:class 3 adenylate cyclase